MPKLALQPLYSPDVATLAPDRLWQKLAAPEAQALLLDEQTERTMQAYQKNIEYFIGTVKLPVGIAGPLRVNHAQGNYLVPLAPTEAALVASYHRGSQPSRQQAAQVRYCSMKG